ncbi:alpha/beta fold hydrolase [Hahella ganghwensis]|uniref:alpha/beta fold hydrolase n=1 Tax=Hahella ganghwensis TaxID=286420 RepID=UPI000380AF62|nr:alpha/beta fold hydrolase [Hahella ganghwensis]
MELSDSQISSPIESLIAHHQPGDIIHHVDVLIIGSGYGGSVAAFRLAHPERSVMVLERGKEYQPGDFPSELGTLPSHIRLQSYNHHEIVGYPDALFDIRHGNGLDILVGNGLGGTSLINANVAKRPDPALFKKDRWPEIFRHNPNILDEEFNQISHWLGVTPAPTEVLDGKQTAKVKKYQALERLGNSLEKNGRTKLYKATVSPADLSVTFPASSTFSEQNTEVVNNQKALNNAGVRQMPCTSCGNCVTGCNVGAKNTLMMNLIPLAHSRGAKFYTGATCLSVEPQKDGNNHWKVKIGRTSTAKHLFHRETFYITANRVILAAGTLGSTEILQRSQKAGLVSLSKTLGKHFSTNGDGLAFSFGREHEVNGIGSPDYANNQQTGPTINGILQVWSNPDTLPLTLEDGAIPNSLSKIFGEILVTSAQLHRLGTTKKPAYFQQHTDADQLANSTSSIKHSQLLLIMGDDGGAGELLFDNPAHSETAPEDSEFDGWSIFPSWPTAAQNPTLATADELLKQQSYADGLDGGQYVPNPFWQLMPPSARSVMSGKLPSGSAISVHPLGGCGMADSIVDGVVNHAGQVYRAADGSLDTLYEGLYVMDGAILPTAVGVNPFLTIAALSWRAADHILEDAGWQESSICKVSPDFDDPTPDTPDQPPKLHQPEPYQPTVLEFQEQLIGHLDTDSDIPEWLFKNLAPDINIPAERITQFRGLILNIRFTINVNEWLENPGNLELKVEADLHVNRIPADDISWMQRVIVDRRHCDSSTLLARLSGTVTLLSRQDIGPIKKALRALNALVTYHIRRRSFFDYIRGKSTIPPMTFKDLVRQARGFLNVALMHTDYRYMTYRLQSDDQNLVMSGHKELAWKLAGKSLWNTLLELPICLYSKPQRRQIYGQLRVNSISLLEDMLPQVKRMHNGPEMFMDLISLGFMIGRTVMQTHFWSFGSPVYPEAKSIADTSAPPLRTGGGQEVHPEITTLNVPITDPEGDHYPMRLAHYRQTSAECDSAPAILFVHGLAQGSRIFTTDTLSTNIAAYFYRHGYHVWTMDYRLSNVQGLKAPPGNWAIDEVAQYDITSAVNHIYQETGDSLHVFAHCVGATAVAMSLLKGWLNNDKVSSVTFNAIHPWVIPSAANRTKAKIGTAVKYWFDDQFLDPNPCQDDSLARQLLDRLAFTVARLDEDAADIHSPPGGDDPEQAICDRMTFFYGRMWKYENLACQTHDDFGNIVGPAPGDVYRHLFYFANRYQITDKFGANAYLKGNNLSRFSGIKTLFIHGEDSQVFNPYSATISAVRFSEANPDTDIRLKRIPGYGHMDIIFANKANEQVYPIVRSFIERSSIEESEQLDKVSFDPLQLSPFHQWLSPPTVTAGPIIRGARRSDSGISVRLWAETNDIDQVTLPGLSVISADGDRIFPHFLERSTAHLAYVFDIEDSDDLTFQLTTFGNMESGPETVAKLELDPDWAWLKRLQESSPESTAEFNFLVGSCRYPGTPFERDHSDQIFSVMHDRLKASDGPDKIFFIGDQIYADATANLLPSEPVSEYYSGRYRSALISPNMQKLLASVPTHFAIDDHEFSDNWSGHWPDSTPEEIRSFEDAKYAALYFLGDYRGSTPAHNNTTQSGSQRPSLWYSLTTGEESSCPVFVTDTRSEREFRTLGSECSAHMMSIDGQLAEIINWLIQSQERYASHPKFIFSGSVLAPLSKKLCAYPELWIEQDDWMGYPATLSRVVDCIVDHQIRNVIFVGGDLHLSSISRLTFTKPGRTPITAWQLVASGLYAPLPFTATQKTEIDWTGQSQMSLPGHPEINIECESTLLTTHYSHFVSINTWRETPENWTLRLKTIDHNGKMLLPETAPHDWLIQYSVGHCDIPLSS